MSSKLLDFGLVKVTDNSHEAMLTKAGGVVGYFLLTGQPPFHEESVLDILMHQVKTQPELPSQRLGKPLSPELEQLLLRCLSKPAAVANTAQRSETIVLN